MARSGIRIRTDCTTAGTVGELKTMHFQRGSYEIELRTSGRTQYAEKVYVVAGKT
jgi:hypothetical protein